MRVLIINSVCEFGSTGKIVADLYDRYILAGDTCYVAYGRGKVSNKIKNKIRIGNNFNIIINGIEARLFDNEGFNAKRQTKEFLRWLNEYKPELIWIHNLHGYYINVSMFFDWIKSNSSVCVKWTLHDCWSFTGHCAYFTLANCQKWKDGCYECPNKHKYPKSICFDNSKNNFLMKKDCFLGVEDMTIIAPSNWLKSIVANSFLNNYRIEVINNEIDKNVFKPTKSDFRKKYNLENKRIILGVASVWTKTKGIFDFLKLSKKITDNYIIVLVGKQVEKNVRKNKNILFIDRTNNQNELAKIYSAADIFVNLSYEDNYPTVLLESLACGVKSITYDVGGCPEIVKDRNMIVDVGDIDKILFIINKILGD